MYSYISGKIKSVNPTSVLIDNQGMGYHVLISLHTYTTIKDLSEVQLFTHCIVKNESQAIGNFAIYGFADEHERSLFLELISVSGVGNNTAQLILSSFEPSNLVQTIAAGNVSALQKVKGIGTKTAQRIIIDLKDKIAKSAGDVKNPVFAGNTVKDEALSALLTLGFSRLAADKAVDKAFRDQPSGASVEAVIKTALGFLAS